MTMMSVYNRREPSLIPARKGLHVNDDSEVHSQTPLLVRTSQRLR